LVLLIVSKELNNLYKIISLLFLFLISSNNSYSKDTWIGIDSLDNNTDNQKIYSLTTDKGLFVSLVFLNSPADKTGLKAGDIILEVDDVQNLTTQSFLNYLQKKNPGQIISLKIIRGNNEKNLKIVLGDNKIKRGQDVVTEESKKITPKIYFLGIYWKKPDQKININYLNTNFEQHYKTKNFVVTCLDINSNASKTGGIKLYDEVLEINNNIPDEKDLYRLSTEPVAIKIKRDNKIILLNIIPDRLDINSEQICVPEFSQFHCKKFYTGKDSFLGKKLKYLYKCINDNKVLTVPFLKDNNNFTIKLATLHSLLNNYMFVEKNPNEYQNIVFESEKVLDEISKIKKNYPEYELPKDYEELLNSLTLVNISNFNFKNRADLKVNKNKLTNEIKLLIDQKIISKGISDLDTLNSVNKFLFYLVNEKEFKYLQSILNEAIDKINWKDVKYSIFISDFYQTLAVSYYEQNDLPTTERIFNQGLSLTKEIKQTPIIKVAYKKLLFRKNSLLKMVNVEFLKQYIKNDWKKENQIAEEFDNLTNDEQKEILKIDPAYIFDIYLSLSTTDSWVSLNNTRPEFSLRALKEIEKNPNIGTFYKIYIFNNILTGALDDNNEFLIKKTLLDIKNFINESNKNEQNLISIKNNFASLSSIYIRNNLNKELAELLNFYEKTFFTDKKNQLGVIDLHFNYFYLTSKSYYEYTQNNYEKSLYYLNKLSNYDFFNLEKMSLKISRNENLSLMEIVMLQDTFPDLFDLYYKLGKLDDLKKITKLFFSKDIDDLNDKDLETLILFSNKSIKILNVLLNYYVLEKNEVKTKFISNFLNNNFSKIYLSNNYKNNVLLEDFNKNLKELVRIGDFNLVNKIFDYSNNLILTKYNESLYQSIWRPSVNDSKSSINLLEVSNLLNSETAFNKAFVSSQIVKNSNTSRDIIRGYLLKTNNSKEIIEYQNLQKELISLSKDESLELKNNTSNLPNQLISNITSQASTIKSSENLSNIYKFKSDKLIELENLIKKNNPEYFNLIKVSGVNLKNIQNKLNDNEAVLDYYFTDDKFALIVINKNSYKLNIKRINYKDLAMLKTKIKKTLQESQGKILPFDVKDAYELNKILFLDYEDQFVNFSKLYVIPDGPLNEIPLYALPRKKGIECLNDCGKIDWNLNNYTFSYLASYENFIYPDVDNDLQKIFKENFSKIKTQIEQNKTYSELKEQTLKILGGNLEKDLNTKNINQYTYLGIGDPDLYESKPQSNSKLDYERFFRSLSSDKTIKPSEIKAYYKPLLGSKEEIEDAAKIFGADRSTILLKENATISKLKQLDLNKFNIIHFATHAEISGKLQGVNEPFLVLSPPKQFTKDDNGILMMSEIMQLNTNADIVILSACNTGANEDSYSGSYTGLAKAFFVSGSKSVLVSDWQVETIAAQKLISLFIKKFSTNNLSYAENLKLSMQEFIKNNNKRSHPIFWAPFVFVGNDREINKTIN